MKVTVVPAQVTTVEDRIIGNLSMLQLLLLLIPVFVGGGMFGGLPPFMEGAVYKYVFLALLGVVCVVLSIRIKGRVLVMWLGTLYKYYSRPGLYLYNKNTSNLREGLDGRPVASRHESGATDMEGLDNAEVYGRDSTTYPSPLYSSSPNSQLGLLDRAWVHEKMQDPKSQVKFESDRKGGLYVRITETEA